MLDELEGHLFLMSFLILTVFKKLYLVKLCPIFDGFSPSQVDKNQISFK
jgi:hypothetical protein